MDKRGRCVETKSLNDCIQDLLHHLAEIKTFTNTPLTLVTYGEQDLVNLCNAIDSVSRLPDFLPLVPFNYDFERFMLADEDLMEKTHYRTSLADPSDTSIMKVVTGKSTDQAQIHDSLYDSKCLQSLFFKEDTPEQS